jgi:hypothetical protein
MTGEIGHRLGRKVLGQVATVARPDTILGWYRKLVAHKFDGSKVRHGPGRPRITREVEQLIVRMASENRGWLARHPRASIDLSAGPSGCGFRRPDIRSAPAALGPPSP